MVDTLHSEVTNFAQKTQRLALVWLEADQVRVLSSVCGILEEIPTLDATQDRVAIALIIGRVADTFVRTDPSGELTVDERQRRVHISDVHIARALQVVRQEYATSALNLQTVAGKCGVSAAYLSHLLTLTTGHGFRTYLNSVRLLHAAHLLSKTALSIGEVADKCGWSSSAALGHEFKNRLLMTPGEYRRWTS